MYVKLDVGDDGGSSSKDVNEMQKIGRRSFAFKDKDLLPTPPKFRYT